MVFEMDEIVRYSQTDRELRLTVPALLDFFQDAATFQAGEAGVGVDVGSSPLRGFAGSSQAASRHASRTQVRSTESIRVSFFAKKREIESFMMVSSFLYGWYAFGAGT